jgi:UDP-3-O-[3-hydroxymyristoyl] N-acetylglucosamine deacetylase
VQKTVKSLVRFDGVGLHSGIPSTMVVHPASAEMGIWFRRTDIDHGDRMVAARWNMVSDARLCTKIENESGVSVSTIEHIMAALAGCGIQNAIIEVDGPEVPILDGSSAKFVAGILDRGVRELDAPVQALRVLKPVEVRVGDGFARFEPAETMEMRFHIDFEDEAIGTQNKTLNLANGSFVRELCDSRTFCRQADVAAMRAAGLALGGSYENAVVVEGARILSPGGLRHADEAVRHKMLDALGDLALAGAPILGRYTGVKAGHAVTNRLLHALFADPRALRIETCGPKISAHLPGAHLTQGDLALVD